MKNKIKDFNSFSKLNEGIKYDPAKTYYTFAGSKLEDRWVTLYDVSKPDSFFIGKDYEEFHFDDFYELDKVFGFENSVFGTKGLPVGHPNRSSKTFDMYHKVHGTCIVRVLK